MAKDAAWRTADAALALAGLFVYQNLRLWRDTALQGGQPSNGKHYPFHRPSQHLAVQQHTIKQTNVARPLQHPSIRPRFAAQMMVGPLRPDGGCPGPSPSP